MTAILASHRPRNWGTLQDMLLVGSSAVAILSSIAVQVAGGTLGLSYHASFKGKNVPDGTFARMATAFRNGNSIRFGLHHTGMAPSTSTKDRPFAAWSANKDVADAYAAKVVGQAESSLSPLKTTDANGLHDVKVKGVKRSLKGVASFDVFFR
ncbi:hypothetical protein A1Q1_07603 [Trichosporon asahii var. asahii CBS 2479]|uniref:Uncharacterized protein n=1 Tax=Trichosporon asahii var. asahii (strain ATCC 90039 / CBS 2479 / JCM 2466 / KCTC 7840 / NBRC 103889/ NCYC 2677 / UAMH 7654) TaxID=1186058 RepID=J6F2E6_TRIAS|nr:hypothetical protein A1Q1_07603 [Trichosporon asahii var. asahii CBS 2479]EJT51139.1 hypothetical protein A1Q1_07603 [Trichosporon asahii var. asahii CBS 2479]